jgi:hypothetical protein
MNAKRIEHLIMMNDTLLGSGVGAVAGGLVAPKDETLKSTGTGILAGAATGALIGKIRGKALAESWQTMKDIGKDIDKINKTTKVASAPQLLAKNIGKFVAKNPAATLAGVGATAGGIIGSTTADDATTGAILGAAAGVGAAHSKVVTNQLGKLFNKKINPARIFSK